jgi:arylsulfatase A
MKLHTYDAGFRVAGIMSWPGKISGGQVVSTPTSSLDFLPTFCQLAKTDVPESLMLDGTSFLPALEGKEIERAKPLFWVYFNAINEARVAMRDGDWKVLARLNGGDFPKLQNVTAERLPSVQAAQLTNFEIYNIREDIDESDNMVNKDGQQIVELQKKLTHAYRELVSESHVWTPTETQQ